jgi:hypothetical protein
MKYILLFFALFVSALAQTVPPPPVLPPDMPQEVKDRIMASYNAQVARAAQLDTAPGPGNMSPTGMPGMPSPGVPSAPSLPKVAVDPVQARLEAFANLSVEEQRLWIAAIRMYAALTPEEREKLKTSPKTDLTKK